MDQNELESTLTDDQNDVQILPTGAYPGVKSLFRLFFAFVFYTIGWGIAGGFFLMDTRLSNSPLLRSFLNLLLYVISLLLTIRYAIKKSKKQQISPFNLSFNKIQSWLVPVVIICTIALSVGLEGVSDLIPMPVSVQKLFERVFTKDIFSLITLIIAAPILEEILCRGIVLKGLLKNYSPNKAILISAIFFSVLHLNPWQALPAFCGGLFLGWVFYKTRSIIPGILIHATVNSTAALFLFLPKHQQSYLDLLGSSYYTVLLLFSALVFVFGCLLIHRKGSPVSG